MALGASEFLTKPFSPKKLYARAADLLGVGEDQDTTGAKERRIPES
jgi:DNA-binding response OmpR family regulator